MNILSTMRSDLSRFGTMDIMVAVVIAVVGRVYMLFASPVINAWLMSLGPIGQAIAPTATAVLYFILLLAAVARSNGVTVLLAGTLMALIRVFTGDPYGVPALNSYFPAGITGWIFFAAVGNRISLRNMILLAVIYGGTVDLIFNTLYLTMAPIAGSPLLGWFVQILVIRVILHIPLGWFLLWAANWMHSSPALRGVVRRPAEAPPRAKSA